MTTTLMSLPMRAMAMTGTTTTVMPVRTTPMATGRIIIR